jgi:hypothetical protein
LGVNMRSQHRDLRVVKSLFKFGMRMVGVSSNHNRVEFLLIFIAFLMPQ